MYNKIFKSDQVSLGIPVQIRTPINIHTVKMAYKTDAQIESDEPEKDMEESLEYKVNPDDILRKAGEDADAIIKEAELEAQRIIDLAENEAKERIQAIEDEARQKGFESGYEEAKRLYEDLLSEAEFIKQQANMEYVEIMTGIEKDAVEVIMDVARKVIGQEIALNKENMLIIVRQALEKCSNRDDITIKVSAHEYDFIVDNKEKLLSMIDGIGNFDIKRDPALKPGACLIETPYGSVDAGIETKLRKIEEAFIKVVGKE